MQTRIVLTKDLSLDELLGRVNQEGETISFEYKLGLYYEMDAYVIGEIANLKRLLESGFLPQKERDSIYGTLRNDKLDPAERKAKERGVRRLKKYLTQ